MKTLILLEIKTIQVEDDVYELLLQNAQVIEQGASSIPKRLIGLPGPLPQLAQKSVNLESSQSAVDECIYDTYFQAEREAVGKFLRALSWLYKKHKDDFIRVVDVRGRKRQYFAKSREILEDSGTSVRSRKIPGSPYWVVTDTDTPTKKKMLKDVMKLLGYSREDSTKLADGLEPLRWASKIRL